MSKFGRCQGYTGKPCSNCGRYRVERYLKGGISGFEICEKCHWCEQLNRYVSDDEFYDDADYEKFWQDMRGDEK